MRHVPKAYYALHHYCTRVPGLHITMSLSGALDLSTLDIEHKTLACPPLKEVAQALRCGLQKLFKHVEVSVVECPDLRSKPFHLAGKGLGGRTALIEVGGVSHLLPTPMPQKLYDMKEIAKTAGFDDFLMLGAGAGPWPHENTNCELIANLGRQGSETFNESRIAMIKDNEFILKKLPKAETRHAMLANLYCCDGNPDQVDTVLKVHCRLRTGDDDFVSCMRKSLADYFKDYTVVLGGAFVLDGGSVRQHVMPDFSPTPIYTDEQLAKWVHYFTMKCPLVALGTLVSSDPGLDLRSQHFHTFSNHGDGGHLYTDISPETVEYLGYFNLAQSIIRIDRPKEIRHKIVILR